MRVSVIVSTAVAVVLAGPSLAQEAERYALERTDTGYVRMDRQTGEMSICTETSGDLVCRKASDERDEDDRGEIGRLRQRIDALETRLAALEAAPLRDELPSEETVEQTLSIMERFFRRFVGIVQDLEKEQKPQTPPASPQKT